MQVEGVNFSLCCFASEPQCLVFFIYAKQSVRQTRINRFEKYQSNTKLHFQLGQPITK
jgi:hypothetical protein